MNRARAAEYSAVLKSEEGTEIKRSRHFSDSYNSSETTNTDWVSQSQIKLLHCTSKQISTS